MSGATPSDALRDERRWVLVGVAVVAVVLTVQLLGGTARSLLSDDSSALELVQRCLDERDVPHESVQDPVASSAGRGALSTIVDGNPVTAALGSSEDDAERMIRAYRAVVPSGFAPARLEQIRRVVLLWSVEPTRAQRDFMLLCTLDANR